MARMSRLGGCVVICAMGWACAALAEPAPAPVTAPGTAPGTVIERRLHVDHVDSSSFLFNSWNKFQENYHPLYVADDDPTTAWVEGKPGPGVGEWIELKVTPMAGASKVRLKIRNGYQKSATLFSANARVDKARITLLPSKVTQEVTLADAQGWQDVVVEQPAGALSAVRIEVRAVHAGRKYEDLCISDVQLFVTATSPDNPAFEKARFQKVQAWKAERLAAAKMFQSATAKSLPVAPQYTLTTDGEGADTKCAWSDQLCKIKDGLLRLGADTQAQAQGWSAVARKVAATLADKPAAVPGAGWRAVQVVVEDKRPMPRVDGLCTPILDSCSFNACANEVELPMFAELGWLSARQLAVFDKKDAASFADVLAAKPRECTRRDVGAVHAWARRGAPGADGRESLEALLVVRCGATESREGLQPQAMAQLLVYDSDGRLNLTASQYNAAGFAWQVRGDSATLGSGRRIALREEPNLSFRRVE